MNYSNVFLLLNSKITFANCPKNWDELAFNHIGIIIAVSTYTDEPPIGFPSGAYQYGCLFTINTRYITEDNESYSNAQIYIPHSNGSDNNIYIRTIRDGDGTRTWRVISPNNVLAIR